MTNNQVLQNDILRYKKNSLPAKLALFGLVFNVLYFCLLYGFKNPTDAQANASWFVTILIAGSVLLTLVMLLVNFLASEGIKSYKKGYCIILLVLAIIQIARIFIYPIYVLQHTEFSLTYFWIRTGSSTFPGIMMIVWLCASAVCLIASSIVGFINCTKRERHIASIESGEVNIDALFEEERKHMEAGINADSTKTAKEEVK